MKRKLVLRSAVFALLPVLVSCSGWLFYRRHSAACKERGSALAAREEKLKRDAHQALSIGTGKEDVIRFFAENDIPVTFVEGEAAGSIHVTGCAPSGCGSNDALLGLRVKVDKEGTVISEPIVGGIYTDCL